MLLLRMEIMAAVGVLVAMETSRGSRVVAGPGAVPIPVHVRPRLLLLLLLLLLHHWPVPTKLLTTPHHPHHGSGHIPLRWGRPTMSTSIPRPGM